jgi:hypothetical protein
MNKKLVIIAASLLLIIGAMFVVQSFVFGLGGTSFKNYDRKIISNAQLQLEVDNVPSAVNIITNITLQQGSFISGSSVNIQGQDVTEEYFDNTARLDNLKKQENRLSEMSTITVNANEPAPFFEGWGITDALKQSVRGFFNSISGLIVFTGNILPIAVYLILVLFIGMGVKRKFMPRFFGKQ